GLDAQGLLVELHGAAVLAGAIGEDAEVVRGLVGVRVGAQRGLERLRGARRVAGRGLLEALAIVALRGGAHRAARRERAARLGLGGAPRRAGRLARGRGLAARAGALAGLGLEIALG